MRKVILVAWREFKQRVSSRGFIISSLALPVILIVVGFFTGFMGDGETQAPLEETAQEATQQAQVVTGYVDHARLIETIPQQAGAETFKAFESETAATAALRAGEIEAYYIIPQGYRQSGDIQHVSQELSALPPDTQAFNRLLIANLFPQADSAQVSQWYEPFGAAGPQFISLGETADAGADGAYSMMPFIVAFAVMIPLFTSGAYLLQSVTEEKSSRIMEILLVSLRPKHLLSGKLLGLGALTLVQYTIWGLIAGLALIITGQNLGSLMANIQLGGLEMLLIVPYAMGGFLLYAGLMAGIGALSPDMEGSRTWVFIITLPMMIPIYFWIAIVNAPNGLLATVLSMVPFSAPIAMLMRMTSTTVPLWQLVTSLGLLLLSAVGMVWLMARLFRAQTLLSGQSPSLSRFVAALRT